MPVRRPVRLGRRGFEVRRGGLADFGPARREEAECTISNCNISLTVSSCSSLALLTEQQTERGLRPPVIGLGVEGVTRLVVTRLVWDPEGLGSGLWRGLLLGLGSGNNS